MGPLQLPHLPSGLAPVSEWTVGKDWVVEEDSGGGGDSVDPAAEASPNLDHGSSVAVEDTVTPASDSNEEEMPACAELDRDGTAESEAESNGEEAAPIEDVSEAADDFIRQAGAVSEEEDESDVEGGPAAMASQDGEDRYGSGGGEGGAALSEEDEIFPEVSPAQWTEGALRQLVTEAHLTESAYEGLAKLLKHRKFDPTSVPDSRKTLLTYGRAVPTLPIYSHPVNVTTKSTSSGPVSQRSKQAYWHSAQDVIEQRIVQSQSLPPLSPSSKPSDEPGLHQGLAREVEEKSEFFHGELWGESIMTSRNEYPILLSNGELALSSLSLAWLTRFHLQVAIESGRDV